MREKQLIERNLPFNDRYQFMGVSRGSILDAQCTSCDNCGKLITNIVTVANKSGKKFHIGTDCSETLLKASALKLVNFSDYDVEMYSLRAVNRFMTIARKAENRDSIEVNSFYVTVQYTDKKNNKKEAQEFRHNIEKYYPEFLEGLKQTA